jgi:hypothetical protein
VAWRTALLVVAWAACAGCNEPAPPFVHQLASGGGGAFAAFEVRVIETGEAFGSHEAFTVERRHDVYDPAVDYVFTLETWRAGSLDRTTTLREGVCASYCLESGSCDPDRVTLQRHLLSTSSGELREDGSECGVDGVSFSASP